MNPDLVPCAVCREACLGPLCSACEVRSRRLTAAVIAENERDPERAERTMTTAERQAKQLHDLIDKHGPPTIVTGKSWDDAVSRVAWLCGRLAALQNTCERVRYALGTEGEVSES